MNESSNLLTVNTDGGSRGNPGKAASAFVITLNGEIIKKDSVYIGTKTNNEAEYTAVRNALNWIVDNSSVYNFQKILFFLDSELVVKQLNGEYKIKNINLQKFVAEIKLLEQKILTNVFYKFIRRENNKLADKLVNEELDNHSNFKNENKENFT